MSPKLRPGFVAVVSAATAAATGALILARSIGKGTSGLRGTRCLPVVVGVLILMIGIWLFVRGLRDQRRARVAAIAALLPAGRRYRRWPAGNDTDDSFLLDDFDGLDEPSEKMPIARAEIRAATRALLVSLEEEMRRDGTGERRAARPACRRARLRAAGRVEPKRRHPRVRSAPMPS